MVLIITTVVSTTILPTNNRDFDTIIDLVVVNHGLQYCTLHITINLEIVPKWGWFHHDSDPNPRLG
jgi:hypothetical protein